MIQTHRSKRSKLQRHPLCLGLWLILCILWMPAWTQAQTVSVQSIFRQTSLAGKWRFRAGDDLRWAQPSWNDRAWQSIQVPSRSRHADAPHSEVVWYRLRLELPTNFQPNKGSPLGLMLGPIRSAYAIYAGGLKIGEQGKLPPHPHGATPRHVVYPLPQRAFQGKTLVLALRTWQPRWLLKYYKGKPRLGRGNYEIGLYTTLKQRVELLQQHQREGYIFQLFLAFLLVLIALYHFHLYRGRDELASYFWYGLMLLCLAAWTASKPIAKYLLWYNDEVGWTLTRTTALFSFGLAIEFSYRALDASRPPTYWQIMQFISTGLGLGCLLFGPRLAPILPNLFLSLFFAGMLLGLLVLVIHRAFKGNPDARTILFGTLIAFSLLLWKYAISAGFLPYVSLPLPLPTIAFCLLVLSMALALSNQYRRTLSDLKARHRELQQIHAAIERFVPYEFLSQLGRDDLRTVQLGDQVQREMSIYFSDIRSFTSIVEHLTPVDTMQFVNQYLDAMEPAITQHLGFIDKYIGDAIMALFEDADNAVLAGIASLQALSRYNELRAAQDKPPIQIGIGLHTGNLVLGTVGSEKRLSCTVLGDSVNLASRVEGLTKLYGTPLLLTEKTYAALQDPSAYHLRHIGRVSAKGKTEPVNIYEVLDGFPPQELDARLTTIARFQEGYEHFVNGHFADARTLFVECSQRCPTDQVMRLYIERCEEYIKAGIPEEWDGVIKLQTK